MSKTFVCLKSFSSLVINDYKSLVSQRYMETRLKPGSHMSSTSAISIVGDYTAVVRALIGGGVYSYIHVLPDY